MNRVEILASGTFFLTLMQVIQYVVSFIFYVAVARVLSPADVGCFSLLLMVLSVFNTITLLALNNAVIKYVSEGLGMCDEVFAIASARKAFKLILAISLPALTISFLALPIISNYTRAGVSEVLSILASAFILNLTSYYGAIMYGYSMFKEVSIQNILYSISSRFTSVLLILFGLKVFGLTLGFLIGAFLTLLYSLAILKGRIKFSNMDFPSSKLLRFSMPIYGANIIMLIQSWLDVAVLSSVVSLSIVGAYYIAMSSVSILSILWSPLSSALFPILSWINGSSNKDEALKLNKKALGIVTAIVLPLSIALASTSRTALSIVYGVKYIDASLPFTILACSITLSAYASIYSVGLQSIGRTKPIFMAGAISIMVYTFLLLTIARTLGQVGAAIARAFMSTISFLILYKEVEIKTPENLKRSIVIAIIIALILIPIELLLNAELYVKAFIELITLIMVLLITFKFIKPLNSDEVHLIKSIIKLRTDTSKN